MTPKPPYAGVPQKPHTVLIIEDNEDGRFMMRTFLQLKGYRVREARDGMEAIAAAASERPDLILMDLQLPRLDGIAVTRELRMQPLLRQLPIVIVSGWDPNSYRAQALTADCDEYLLKPVDFSLLEEVLTRYLPRVPASVAFVSGEFQRGSTPVIAPH